MDKKDVSILKLLAKGMTAGEISGEILISHRTIEARIERMKFVNNAKNVVSLVYKMAKRGVI